MSDTTNLDPTVPVIEADDALSDYADDGSVASSSQSLSDSILEHVYENGRRYHRKSADQYTLPSDEAEQDRLDMVHHLLLCMFGGRLCLTDFDEDPHRVLDCGTGTGVWALDFGHDHPASEVVGTDLAPIQPTWSYPNVKFELDDLEKEWTWKKDYFNFIHARMISMGIRNYGRLVEQMFEHTAPGGRIELTEHTLDAPYCDDGTLPADNCLYRYFAALSSALEQMGVNPRLHGPDFRKMVEDAGFVDVKLRKLKLPWGPWPRTKTSKYQGLVALETLKTGLEAYGLSLMTRSMSHEEATALIKETYEVVASGKCHVYLWVSVVTARKPGSAESADSPAPTTAVTAET
ncbi:S-adenosyl-L-methionine-dependent methyltransferase [Ascodesmis nigricans]|uniref:S-adenosyl-L-methionine-dependent methyltransferase n=1 Tax=Ascodesmis nigricans TaxID=341454 RepID=A0A4S2MRE7_9PEZI|nr:S-adenosyl-L-methionine-dependent methyltransferase [Ascodesmis nigricans]